MVATNAGWPEYQNTDTLTIRHWYNMVASSVALLINYKNTIGMVQRKIENTNFAVGISLYKQI